MYDSDESDTPGGDDFVDVTSLFRDAAEGTHHQFLGLVQIDVRRSVGLPEETVILTDGFTLMDSMSAIEVSSSLL